MSESKSNDFATNVSDPTQSTIVDAGNDGHIKLDKHGKVKVPRRLIHCSDGILEEYSTDEEEEEPPPPPPVDTKKLTWGPYLWYYTVKTAFGGLAVCDYFGEKLAYMFGITSPKYQYAISEWERMQEEDKEEEELEQQEIVAENRIIREATISSKDQRSPSMEMGDASAEERKKAIDANSIDVSVL